jgi:hypothetical protein
LAQLQLFAQGPNSITAVGLNGWQAQRVKFFHFPFVEEALQMQISS